MSQVNLASARVGAGSTFTSRALTATALAWAVTAAGAAPEQAASADGSWQLQGTGSVLELRDSQTRIVKRFAVPAADHGASPQVARIHHAALRRSFVVTFHHLPQVWEISLDPHAEPLYQGLVHDFRMGEGVSEPGFLGVRRMRLPAPLPASALDASGSYLVGRAADSAAGRAVLHLVHLDVRRSIARFDCDADPDLSAAHPGPHADRPVLVVPDRRGGPALRIDLDRLGLLDTPACTGAKIGAP